MVLHKWLFFCLAVAVAGWAGDAQAAKSKQSAKPKPKPDAASAFPDFGLIQKIVNDSFSTRRIGPTSILSRGDVTGLFPLFEKAGWKVEDQQDIVNQLLPDNDFLVRQLRTPDGRVLAKQLSTMPLGFDRADHLRKLSRGDVFLSDMVRGPDGWKLFQYMTETPEGMNMGGMLSDDPGGANFNKPTGNVYTSEKFVRRLRESYDRSPKNPQKKPAPATNRRGSR